MREKHLWTIVLAAGEGKRLLDLTYRLHGHALPKQFASFSANNRSLLQSAVDDINALLPRERIVVVVPAAHLELAEFQLASSTASPGTVGIVSEPQNRGTAASLLLGLAKVLAKDPDADIAVIPAAHVLQRADAFLDGILRARRELDSAPVTLLAVAAKNVGPEHTWIIPGRPIQRDIYAAADFAFSPPRNVAHQLLCKRALWDTLCVVADVRTLWRVSVRQLAQPCQMIREAVSTNTPEALRNAYATISSADFTRDVLARQLGVAVTDVASSGFAHVATVEQALHAFPGLSDRCGGLDAGTIPEQPSPASASERHYAELTS